MSTLDAGGNALGLITGSSERSAGGSCCRGWLIWCSSYVWELGVDWSWLSQRVEVGKAKSAWC